MRPIRQPRQASVPYGSTIRAPSCGRARNAPRPAPRRPGPPSRRDTAAPQRSTPRASAGRPSNDKDGAVTRPGALHLPRPDTQQPMSLAACMPRAVLGVRTFFTPSRRRQSRRDEARLARRLRRRQPGLCPVVIHELDHPAVPVGRTSPCPMRARSTAAPRSLAATHRQADPLGPDVTASQVVPSTSSHRASLFPS